MTDSTTSVKTCIRCGVVRAAEEFHRNKAYKDGRRSACKHCMRESSAAYRAANPERSRESTRRWRRENPEALLAGRRAYLEANRDLVRERARAYKAANPDKVREWKRNFHKAHADKICEAGRQWRLNNPQKTLAYREANAEKIREQRKAYNLKHADKRRAHMQANPEIARAYVNKRRARKASQDCGCVTPQSILLVASAYGDLCVYCRGPHEHMDHLVPLSKGGRHCVHNLRPSCAACNTSKFTSSLDAFLQRRPELSGDLARLALVTCPNQ